MKLLLFGMNGQLGWELQRSLAPLGELTALGSAGAPPLSGRLDDLAALAGTIRSVRPDVIVNAAAHTDVDGAEANPTLAMRINGEAPGVMAREAAALGAWLVHYSTDYVFDGSGEAPWREDAPTAPLQVYGRSKLAGEEAIRASGCRHLLFRTSWVYAARGRNFARTMLRLAGERESLAVVADQCGAPTGAELLADVTALALNAVRYGRAPGGTYHVAAAGETSWHGYASHLIGAARRAGAPLRVRAIEAVPSAAYPAAAARPLNSRLDTSRLRSAFGMYLPPWQDGVDRVLAEILAAERRPS